MFADDQNLKNIYHKMIDYLSTADMSETRLVNRVCRLKKLYPHTERYREYTPVNCWKVIEVLRSQGFVNEERYAERLFVSLKDKKDGMRAIRRKMLQRAIKADIVDGVIDQYHLSGQRQELRSVVAAVRIRKLRLQKKFADDPHERIKIRQNVYGWLMLRGYDQEDMRRIMNAAGV